MVFVGIDWSEKSHRVVILDDDGQQLETRQIEHSHLGLQELGSILHAHASPDQVLIAVEMHGGLLLDWLVQHDCPVYGINPKSAERARDRFSPAGLNDDERDAWCLAEFLRSSHQHLRPLRPDSDQTLALMTWVRLREDLIQERTVHIQRLRSHLAMWHPHVLKAIRELSE